MTGNGECIDRYVAMEQQRYRGELFCQLMAQLACFGAWRPVCFRRKPQTMFHLSPTLQPSVLQPQLLLGKNVTMLLSALSVGHRDLARINVL